jgi:hypothetical protein
VIIPEERRHLMRGPRPGEVPGGVGTVSVLARGADPSVVVDRCQSVMLVVLDHSGSEWPTVEQWRSLLPAWFVAACGPEKSREEAERWLEWWRKLGPADRARAERLYWVEPSERQWYWWDSAIGLDGTLRLFVEVCGWPAPLGALDWLLGASGAAEIVHEETLPSGGIKG